MSFAAPLSLALGAVALVALWAFWRRADAHRRRALEQLVSPQLAAELQASVSARRRAVKRGLLFAGAALALVALAGPELGFDWQESKRRGIDVLIAVDVSRSMFARDVNPDRIGRAKLAVADLLGKLEGDRVGLIAFAGSAFLQCPLTLDHAAFEESLDALEPGIIPVPGSDLASALLVARDALRTEGSNIKLVVLFSDGEDLGGGALEAAREIAADGVKLYTVGVGSSSGELIPIPDAHGGTAFLKDPSGQFVKSRLDEKTLREVAEATGGFYVPLGQRGEGVDEIDAKALKPIPRQELASRMRRVPRDRFQIPLALALLCLAAEPLVRDRVAAGGRAARRRAAARAAALAAAVALLRRDAPALASPQSAARLYDEGHYDEALAAYEEAAKAGSDDPRIDFNLGAAAYRAGKHDAAASAFARALRAKDPALQERAFYDLGNAQYRLGEQSAASAPDKAMKAWQQSLEAYESALKLDGQDADAKYNRDLVERRIEQLKQQQQQQKQQAPQDQKQDERDQSGSQSEQQAQKGGEGEPKSDHQQTGENGQQSPERRDDRSSGAPPTPSGEPERAKPGAEPSSAPQPKPSAAPQPKPSAAPQPAATPGDGSPSSGASSGGQPEPGSPQGKPAEGEAEPRGEMSPADARQLLDSLKGEESQVPFLAAPRPPRSRPDQPVRDW